MDQDRTAALCLAGGNALGAYQAGLCAALLDAGFRFPSIAATSIGAVHAALILGAPPGQGAWALRDFWAVVRQSPPILPALWPPFLSVPGLARRRVTLLQTLMTGHSRLFRPKVPGLLSLLAGVEVGRSLFDRAPMRALLAGMIDLDRLNAGETRLFLAAVDAGTGENLCFDSAVEWITLDHLMAVTAFPLLFDPVRIGGRDVVDAGVRRNLPLDLIPDGPLPVLALDLFPLAGGLPGTLTGVAARAQDLMMAGQAADALDRFRARSPVPLVHAAPDSLPDLTATKTLDFSDAMIADRWARGQGDAAALIAAWPGLRPGLWRLQAGGMGQSDAAGDAAIDPQALPGDVA